MIELILSYWIFWLSYRLGNTLLVHAGIPQNNRAENILYSIGIGIGLLAFTILGLGQINFLYSRIIYSIFILFTIYFIFLVKNIPVKILQETNRFHFDTSTISLCIVLGLVGITNISGALTPELRHDSLQYHLSIPHYYILFHRMLDVPYTIYHFYSLNMEMLYTLSLLLKNGILAKLLHAELAIFTAYGIYLIAKRYTPSPVPILASALFYSLPQVAWMSSTTFNENSWMFYGVLSIMAWLTWFQSQDKRWLYLTALFCGLGITIKLIVIVFYPFLLGLTTLIVIIKRRQFRNLSHLIIYGLIVLVPVIPWLTRNYIYTLNPVFPLLTNVFHSYSEYIVPGSAFHNIRQFPAFSIMGFLHRMVEVFIAIQINGNGMMPMFLLAVFVGLLFWKNMQNGFRFLMFYGIAIWLIYNIIEGGQDGRFMYPTYPIMALFTAYSLWMLLKKIPQLSKLVIVMLSIALTLTFVYGRYGFYQDFLESPLPVLGDKLQEKYLDTHLPLYPSYHYVNQHLPENSFLILPAGYGALYCNRKYVAGSEFDHAPYSVIFDQCTSAEEIKSRLNEWNITHLVVSRNKIEIKTPVNPETNFMKEYTETLFSDSHFAVLKINYKPLLSKPLTRS